MRAAFGLADIAVALPGAAAAKIEVPFSCAKVSLKMQMLCAPSGSR
jgi:hypothetical protein